MVAPDLIPTAGHGGEMKPFPGAGTPSLSRNKGKCSDSRGCHLRERQDMKSGVSGGTLVLKPLPDSIH